MVFVVGHAGEFWHRNGGIPVVAVGPYWSRLVVGGVGIGELIRRQLGGVHDLTLCVVGVGRDVPACSGRVPLDLVASIDFKHVSAAACFGHRCIDGDAVDTTDTRFILP